MKLCLPKQCELVFDGGSASFYGAPMVCVRDAKVRLTLEADTLRVQVTAASTPLRTLRLHWDWSRPDVKVLGDAWERAYGDLAWLAPDPERVLPWYCLASNGSDLEADLSGRLTEGFGVKVRPGAMASWTCGGGSLVLTLDLRCGGEGVLLGGRTLDAAEVVFGEYAGMTAFDADKAFCRVMCSDPLPLPRRVFGSNNWYYAYGHSSREQILRDTALAVSMCGGDASEPSYMVIDACWSPYLLDAPWIGGRTFGDMASLAAEIRSRGAVPGLWVSYLADAKFELTPSLAPDEPDAEVKAAGRVVSGPDRLPPEARLSSNPAALDPSHPAVLQYVRELTKTITGWGYGLIKHDYSTNDLFSLWALQGTRALAKDGWAFFDRSKTTAEVLVGFYRAILESSGGAVLIGCNTVSHLIAGLTHLNRTGDDTSGREWERTHKMGYNTLAFRAPQDGAFYACDADCLGEMGQVSWEQNRLWLERLAESGTPMFVSCDPNTKPEIVAEIRDGFARWHQNGDVPEPKDWMEHSIPEIWR